MANPWIPTDPNDWSQPWVREIDDTSKREVYTPTVINGILPRFITDRKDTDMHADAVFQAGLSPIATGTSVQREDMPPWETESVPL